VLLFILAPLEFSAPNVQSGRDVQSAAYAPDPRFDPAE
jgi:hypothetical protein